jgi:predicted RNase H-like nuclease (RuvC/YqgF family)
MKLLNLHIDDLKTKNMDLEKAFSEISERKGGNFSGERKNLEESIRLKQNNINSLKALLTEKDKKVQDLEYRLASLSSENAIIKSYKETFMYIFNETLKWMTGKSHKMKHSISTLTSEDEDQIKKIFKEVNLKPPL